MVITVMLFAVVWTSRLSIDIDKDPSTGDYGFVRPPVPTSKFVDSIEIFPDVSNSCSCAHRWLGLNRDETLIELTQTVTSLRSRTLVIWWNGYVYETLKLLALTASGRKFQSFPFLQDYVLGPVRMPVRALLTQYSTIATVFGMEHWFTDKNPDSSREGATMSLLWRPWYDWRDSSAWRVGCDKHFVGTKFLDSESGEHFVATGCDVQKQSFPLHNHSGSKNRSCFVCGTSHMKECNWLCLPK